MAYCDVNYADGYFANRAFSEKWTGDRKSVYLETATTLIRRYCEFEDEYGKVFTYKDDASPDWLKDATCEEALYLLNLGKDPTQPLKVHTLGIIRTDDGTTFDHQFSADILCASCRTILESNGGIISSEAVVKSTIKQGRWIR